MRPEFARVLEEVGRHLNPRLESQQVFDRIMAAIIDEFDHRRPLFDETMDFVFRSHPNQLRTSIANMENSLPDPVFDRMTTLATKWYHAVFQHGQLPMALAVQFGGVVIATFSLIGVAMQNQDNE
jgi:hypothetical protein